VSIVVLLPRSLVGDRRLLDGGVRPLLSVRAPFGAYA
jgi:hypothetical protein